MRHTPFRAAVIGLGNIGFLLGTDPKRQGTWSHSHAYNRCPLTELAAAADPDPAKRDIFAKAFPKVPLYNEPRAMLKAEAPDLVSICTPTPSHPDLFALACDHAKGVLCEKPMAPSPEDCLAMRALAESKGVVGGVNHNRRWQPNHLRAAEIIASGEIGELRALHAFYPGQIWNIGTHLFDALRMLAGDDPVEAVAWPVHASDSPDPSVTGLLSFSKGLTASLAATGKREDLVFEIDAIGSEGRVRLTDNGFTLSLERFAESPNYTGYRELVPAEVKAPGPGDPLLAAVEDMARCLALRLEGDTAEPACSLTDGYYTIAILHALLESARCGHQPQPVPAPAA